MSISLSLNNALSGLAMSQKALDVISHNIANANTEGYSRQQVDLSALYLNNNGSGVRIDDVTRKVDTYLQRAVQSHSSEVGRTEILQDYMDRIQIMLGKPGAQNSIAAYLTSFTNAIQSLAESPDKTSSREQAVSSGENLAYQVSSLAAQLEDLRYQADQDINQSVTTINVILTSIHATNIAISNAKVLGNSIAGLQDQQDQNLNKLAQYMDIKTYMGDNSEVNVYSSGGIALSDQKNYQLSYRPVNSPDSFSNEVALNALTITAVNDAGEVEGSSATIISSGTDSDITTTLKSGSLKALHELRDQEIPDILAQLDQLAANLRDSFNALNNDGSSYPGTDSLTGDRVLRATDSSDWSGIVQIAALDNAGQPIDSPYDDEAGKGIIPLSLDLSKLESGLGQGQPTIQTIIDEINNYFGPPPLKTELGNLNNIQLVSDTSALPDTPAMFSFDFDLHNISDSAADFFVTGITVLDDTGANITNVTTPPPQFTISSFSTTNGSPTVTVNAVGHSLSTGGKVYISDPGGAINGINSSSFNQYFEVTNVTANSFDILLPSNATSTATTAPLAATTGTSKWDSVDAGEKQRTRDTGIATVDLSGNSISRYYDITVNVGVDDNLGTASSVNTATVTYRILNSQQNLLNDRYNSTAVTGQASRIFPTTSQPTLRAMLVDADGNELATNNGIYTDTDGYLKLETYDPDNSVALQEGTSQQLGFINTNPAVAGTDWGFSHYFGLNNFFRSNNLSSTGDSLKNSALNLAVEDRLLDNANLISTGKLEASPQSADVTDDPVYTYVRYGGNAQAAKAMANLSNQLISFEQAGGLANSNVTFSTYSGQILANVSNMAAQATSSNKDSQTLLDGFVERVNAISGVNIDEEMANIIIFQHAYSASARVITVTNELFGNLLDSIR